MVCGGTTHPHIRKRVQYTNVFNCSYARLSIWLVLVLIWRMVSMSAYTYVKVYIKTYKYTSYIYIYTGICMYPHMFLYVYIYMYMHAVHTAYARTHCTCAHMQMYMHTALIHNMRYACHANLSNKQRYRNLHLALVSVCVEPRSQVNTGVEAPLKASSTKLWHSTFNPEPYSWSREPQRGKDSPGDGYLGGEPMGHGLHPAPLRHRRARPVHAPRR